MKKMTIILVIMIGMTITLKAQIPNNGFENWNSVGNCMKPSGWFSTNDFLDTNGTYFGITRSNDHYPAAIGSYSLRIQNNTSLAAPSSFGLAWPGDADGSNYPSFAISGHPTSFCGYYKFLPENKDTMRIFICLYKNGTEVVQAKLEDTVTVSSWSSFIIPIPTYTDADSARIFLSSFNSNGAMLVQGNSVLYIDNLSFDNLITSASELTAQNELFSLYPNPASNFVTLKIESTNKAKLILNIYDAMGSLVRSEALKQNQEQISIEDLSNGIYWVAIKSKDQIESQRLIIQR